MLGACITGKGSLFPASANYFLPSAKIVGIMSNLDENDLKYPLGRYTAPATISPEQRGLWIEEMAKLPANLSKAVAGLSNNQLDTPYRPGGWTVRQVVHHLPDSHMQSYTRFRLALTENSPVIKPYEEGAWAELSDAKTAAVAPSLALIDGLHTRFVLLLNSMTNADFAKTFRHPELGERRLDWTLGLYAWHCLHHVAHITNLRSRQGW
jgi:hypothetical protein